jgi:hypothetical protein
MIVAQGTKDRMVIVMSIKIKIDHLHDPFTPSLYNICYRLTSVLLLQINWTDYLQITRFWEEKIQNRNEKIPTFCIREKLWPNPDLWDWL